MALFQPKYPSVFRSFEFFGRSGAKSAVVRFMLARGREFRRGSLPRRVGGWFHIKKQCFRNAYLNVHVDPALYAYCEGFCWNIGSDWAFKHAWFCDRTNPNIALD